MCKLDADVDALKKRPIDELKSGPGSRDTTPSAAGSKGSKKKKV